MRKVSFLPVLLVLLFFTSAGAFPLFPTPPILDMPLPRQQLAGYGWSLAVSDVTGDGYADIVVGAPYVNSDTGRLQMGKVYVYDGRGGCLITTLDWSGADDAGLVHFGKSVAVGDFNGDGIPDILVGAPDDDVTFADDGLRYENVGRVFVFYGPFSGTQPANRTADFFIDKPGPHVAGAQFGYSIAIGKAHPAGDNEQEALIGAPQEQIGANPALGQAYIVKYNAGTPTSVILGPAVTQDNVRFGEAVAIGPLSGAVDGSREFVVGAPGQNSGAQSQVGAVYVWSYSDATLGGVATTIVQKPLNATYAGFLTLFFGPVGISPDTNSYFGATLAVGDINNDGITELVVGAPNEGLVVIKSGLGTVWTFAGNGLGAGPLFGYLSPNAAAQSGMQFGTSLAIGDIDKDGTKDIIIGSPFEQVTVGGTPFDTAGRIFLVRSNMGFTIDGTYLTGAFVEAFTGPYDLTNIVGVVNMTGLHNHEADGRFGWAVASGNINNSGIDDIAVTGIRLDSPTEANSGRVFLFIEDAQPSAPAIVAPANGSTVTTKLNVTLSAGLFVDNDVAACTGTAVWTDQHSATQWRVATSASADCTTDNVLDQTVVSPAALTGLTIPNLFTLSPLFNFGGTVYWCVRYKDNVSGTTVPGEVWSPWSTASFIIGVPNLIVTAVADPNQATSPYTEPSFTTATRPPVPPDGTNGYDTVDFKTLSCIDFRTVNITITNSGTADAPVLSPISTLGGANYSVADVFGSDCTTPQSLPFTLAPGASFCVAVLFTSGAPATFTDTLRVTYDDPIFFDVALTGASAAPVADISVAEPLPYPTIDLGTFVLGDPSMPQTVTISETGGLAPLKVTNVLLTLGLGTTPANFTWAWTDTGDQTLPRYVPAGGSLSITVTFTPAAGAGCGLKQATLEVTTNSGCSDPALTEGVIYTATVTGPDLLGSWVRFSSTLTSDGGEAVRGVLRVQNMGTPINPANLPIIVSFYLSDNTTFTPGVDTFLYDFSLNYAFGTNEVKHIAFTYKFDAPKDGQYIIAVIDSANTVLECSDYPVDGVTDYTPYPLAGYQSNNVVIPVKGGTAYPIFTGF